MPTALPEPQVLKNAKQCLFMPTPSKKAIKCQTMSFHANTIKKGQKMPNYDVHAKHHFFMPNHFKKG